MEQKSSRKGSRRKRRSGTFGAQPVDTFRLKRRSASYWKDCAGRRALPNCVGAAEGVKPSDNYGWSKETWRPARGNSPATQLAPRPPTR